ncbi:MAG TPA: alpha-L-arabinofuranosidase C-terminal domain-containing protein [Pyrinomonadaceae bacterium]|nr:alpha-L-arabinofuranosidase C-terminal domain-containing protein [Pyrinomonadaceae bacterium]
MKRARRTARAPLLVRALLAALCVALSQPAAFALSASVTVDASKVENEISPLLYGQFMEFMFEGVKGGVHAELLRDRSFEGQPNVVGLPRGWERYPDDRGDDYGLAFAWDERVSYPPARTLKVETGEKAAAEHSLRVESSDGVVERHGVYQPRVPVVGGAEYRARVWLRGEAYAGVVALALESDVNVGEVYASADVSNVSGEWRAYEVTLKPSKSDPLARFCVLFRGRGRAWVDKASLMPSDAAPGGVRRDVFERVKLLRPAFIRWPGGNVAQDYRWMWAVGPRDERFTWVNLSWKNEPEPGDFGTDEFVAFARAVRAEPSITVNVEGRGATAEEAAAWVEYCNGAATTKYGAMRAANGHPEPYGVRLWEVGNEIWGDWVRGHSDAGTYARNFNAYARAMRAADPSIKLIAVGDNDMRWNRAVLRESGAGIDYLAVHHYYGRNEAAGDAGNILARPLFYEKFYGELAGAIRELAPGRDIRLAINEWGLDLPAARQYSMESALYGARLMNVFERAGSVVAMSAVSDLVNGWPGGIIQAGRHGTFVSPVYLVNQIYAETRGVERLAATVRSPTFDTTKEGRGVPSLDAVATRAPAAGQIFVRLVNTAAEPLDVNIKILNAPQIFIDSDNLSVYESMPPGSNSFVNPDAVVMSRGQMRAGGDNSTVTVPKRSVSVVVFRYRIPSDSLGEGRPSD